MINPNRTHRAKATITKLGMYLSEFKLVNGHSVSGFDIDSKFKVGDVVNIQASYSICLDRYVVKTVNFPRTKKAA